MIYVDADGCAVKAEVVKVATRYGLPVRFVAGSPQRIPMGVDVQLVTVGAGFDAADDWIAERAGEGDIVVTTDIPLAARCLAKGAAVLGPKGKPFTEDSIGEALAGRALSDHLRQMGVMTGGPAPMANKDRSRFLAKLDELIVALRRA